VSNGLFFWGAQPRIFAPEDRLPAGETKVGSLRYAGIVVFNHRSKTSDNQCLQTSLATGVLDHVEILSEFRISREKTNRLTPFVLSVFSYPFSSSEKLARLI
jgi:hypothetical protein